MRLRLKIFFLSLILVTVALETRFRAPQAQPHGEAPDWGQEAAGKREKQASKLLLNQPGLRAVQDADHWSESCQ